MLIKLNYRSNGTAPALVGKALSPLLPPPHTAVAPKGVGDIVTVPPPPQARDVVPCSPHNLHFETPTIHTHTIFPLIS